MPQRPADVLLINRETSLWLWQQHHQEWDYISPQRQCRARCIAENLTCVQTGLAFALGFRELSPGP